VKTSKVLQKLLTYIVTGAIVAFILYVPNLSETTRIGLVLAVPTSFLLLLYVLSPILFHQRHYQVSCNYEAFDPKQEIVPLEFWDTFRHTTRLLVGTGFKPRGHFRRPGSMPGANLVVTVWTHQQNHDIAEWAAFFTKRQQDQFLLFISTMSDGTEVVTTNRASTSVLPMPKKRLRLYLPDIHDSGELYEIHGKVVELLGTRSNETSLNGDPAVFLNSFARKDLKLCLERGYYYLDPTIEVYRPTWKGAIMMTWKDLWPGKPIRRAWRKHQTNRLLRKLEE
jgi:hypothetical protein